MQYVCPGDVWCRGARARQRLLGLVWLDRRGCPRHEWIFLLEVLFFSLYFIHISIFLLGVHSLCPQVSCLKMHLVYVHSSNTLAPLK